MVTADVWKTGQFALWVGPGSVGSVIGAIGNTKEPHGAPDLSHKTDRRYINTAAQEEPNNLGCLSSPEQTPIAAEQIRPSLERNTV